MPQRNFIFLLAAVVILLSGTYLLTAGQKGGALNVSPSGKEAVATGEVDLNTQRLLIKTDAATLASIAKEEGLTIKEDPPGLLKKLGMTVVEVPDDSTTEEMQARVSNKLKKLHPTKTAKEEFVEIDAKVSATLIPNDTNYPNEWHQPKMGSPAAWDSSTGTGITIAILDTGTDCTHPDLAAHCVAGWNVYDNNSDTSDVQGHGTMTAGVAGAIGNNAAQVAGTAFNASIMPIRITDTTGYAYYSTITTAINYAADHGANIANISFTGVNGSSSIATAANYMRSKGGLVFTASGNSGTNLGCGANYSTTCFASPDIIAVGGTDSTDTRASYSTYGVELDLAAPSSGIYTTMKGGGIGAGSGTSFASPNAAGVAALVMAVNTFPKTSDGANMIEKILENTAVDLGTAGWDQYYGWGRVDAAAAVAQAKAMVITSDTTPPTVPANLSATATSSSTVSLSWSPSSDDRSVPSYEVSRNGSKVGTTASTSYYDSGLAASTAYTYTVRAFDASNNYSASSAPVSVTTKEAGVLFTVAPYVISKTQTSAVIHYETNKDSTGVVSWGTQKALTNTVNDTTVGTVHDVTVSGLTAGSTYNYRVTVTGTDGTKATSATSTFKTVRAARR